MIDVTYIDLDRLKPNPWNPNVMTDDMLAKERASIREFGFIDPITVRLMATNLYQIIDGEHRWKAARLEGLNEIPCVVVDVDDATAQQLTIVLNDLRGKADEERLSALVRDLSAKRSMLDLEKVLPYRREKLAEMIAERRADFDWDSLKRPKPEPKEPEEKWVERIYRLPIAAAHVVDEAITTIKRDDGVHDDWQALELICADFNAGRG